MSRMFLGSCSVAVLEVCRLQLTVKYRKTKIGLYHTPPLSVMWLSHCLSPSLVLSSLIQLKEVMTLKCANLRIHVIFLASWVKPTYIQYSSSSPSPPPTSKHIGPVDWTLEAIMWCRPDWGFQKGNVQSVRCSWREPQWLNQLWLISLSRVHIYAFQYNQIVSWLNIRLTGGCGTSCYYCICILKISKFAVCLCTLCEYFILYCTLPSSEYLSKIKK